MQIISNSSLHLFSDIPGRIGNALQDCRELIGRNHQADLWAQRIALGLLAAIVVTGAAVRLTGSGLGCSDWPTCEQDRFVPEAEFHGWVEFGNRLVTGLVSGAVALSVLGSLARTPRRTDLVAWSWGLVAGVAAQILLGGIVVLSHLNPWLVLGHFALSMVCLLYTSPSPRD